MTQTHRRRWLALILAAYLLLAFAYGRVNPLFESPDEHWHYFTTQYIADHWRLPAVTADYNEWLSQEAAQPPLYYLLGALLIAPIGAEQGREWVWLNPFAVIGDASATTNINRFVHTPAEAWPWQDFALAAHLLRLFSTLLGLGTLLCIYGSGRLLWPAAPEIALLATALTAFLPQFLFLHAAISNDTLIIFLTSAALWQILWLWQKESTAESAESAEKGRRSREVTGRLLLLGVTSGLAILSKNAGLLLLFYAIGFLMVNGQWSMANGQRGRSLTIDNWQLTIGNLLLVLLPALLIGGWLWLRNWGLYGDPLATEPFIRIAGGDRGYTIWQVLAESDGLWQSLFAVFGWFNLRPPDWLFWVWNGLVVAAVGGGVKLSIVNGQWSMVNGQSPIALLLLGWVLLVYAGLVAFMLRTEAAQGRLLFPAIVPLALGLAYGLSGWRWRGVYWLAPLLALATSLYGLLFVIAPAYRQPPLVAALPADATPLTAVFGDGLQLVGARVETETAVPGDLVWSTLYWQIADQPESPPEFVLEILGRDLERVGNLHSYHGRGLYPATLWPTGAIIADRFATRVGETAVSPTLAPIFVGLANETERVHIGAVKIAPETWPEAAGPPLAELGEAILLTAAQVEADSARPGDPVIVRVQWQTRADPGGDYTILLHLGAAGQPPLATGDNQPLGGQYPTRAWAANEVINDQHTIVIPADLANGRYPLWLGLYDADLLRLPLTINGERQPGDVFWLGEVVVSR
jgi:hypothetical protein